MIGEQDIVMAIDRLSKLGPGGNLGPEDLCALIGIEYEAIKQAASTSAINSILYLLENADANGGLDGEDLMAGFATEHMLGFMAGVTAHHISSGEMT